MFVMMHPQRKVRGGVVASQCQQALHTKHQLWLQAYTNTPVRGAMQLQHTAAAGLMMQPVNILCQNEVTPATLLQPR